MSSRLVHIIDDIPEFRRDHAQGAGPVLIVSLDGFLDAGNASALAAASLLSSSEGRVVASFDIEEFHDYRARRPATTFHEDRYSDYEAPRLVVQLLRDELDQVYLLLNGPEPDMRWEGFAKAVAEVVEHFGVRQVISLGSVPMAVPHSRPIQLTQHITREDQRIQDNVWSGEIRVPASAQSLTEIRLGEWGHPAQGFVAHIPHYVAQADYPEAAVALLRAVEDVSGLQWDHADPGRGRRGTSGRDRGPAPRERRRPAGRRRARAAVRRLPRRPRREPPGGRRDRPTDRGGDRCPVRAVPRRPGQRRSQQRARLMPRSVDELVDLLELETIEDNLFRGKQPNTVLQRVFGGQVAAHALVAAIRTTPEKYQVHSLHSYFLRPGDVTVPIVYDVEALRDGRSFAARRVVARQHGRPIYYLTASFQVPEPGLDHQDPVPDVPGPEECITLAEARGGKADDTWSEEWGALDVRYAGFDPETGRVRLWIKVDGDLGDDPVLNLAAFTYASDLTLLAVTLAPHGLLISSPGIQAASLDHTIWFHRPIRADRWWLYDQSSPSASGARGLAIARVFQDGQLIASVAQEGLIRPVD